MVATNPQQLTYEKGAPEEKVLQYLTFQLAGEIYAINILHVREIIEFGNLTPVPMMPEFIVGVINLRGSVVPIVDLSARFGGSKASITKRTSIVIIELQSGHSHIEVGVIVDIVNDVLEILDSDIEAPPSFGSKIRTDFIEGMGKVEGRFLVLLQIDKVLSVDELSVAQSMGDDTPSGEETPGMV